jgi:mannan endo-1,4-beta-mannosidase
MLSSMKLILVFLLLVFSSCKTASDGVNKNNSKPKLTDRSKAGIVEYMKKVISSNCILSGQQCGDGDNIETVYTNEVERMNTLTGKKPAIIGTDFGWKADQNFSVITDRLIQYWNAGGLVTISWHVDNPFTTGYDPRINSVTNKSILNLADLLQAASPNTAQSNFTAELNRIIVQLKALKNQGVTVIWRPFHEMNGDWFWWGIDSYGNGNQTNVENFKNLWKEVYEILVNDNKLDNLIWVFSPSKTESWTALPATYYPGSDFVDIIGIDTYTTAPEFSDYTSLSLLNKPMVIGEIGPARLNYGSFDESAIPTVLAGKAAYFLQWHSWTGAKVSINRQLKLFAATLQ